MIPTKEQLAFRLLGTVLALAGLGVGMNELDRLVENKHMQEVTKQAVELIKQPEKAFQPVQTQPQQTITVDRLIDFTKPFQYELSKPLVMEDLCQYYPAMQQCKDKAIAKKGEEKDEQEKQN